jgi:cell wall-associated NlpC family hydrolase
MQSQIVAGIPFGICTSSSEGATQIMWFGDHTLDIPLEGRPFIFGMLDCYDLIRSTFWQQRQIKLKNFPRWTAFWDDNTPLYEDYYPDAGFVPVNDLQKYDVILMKIGRSEVANHAAIYIGDHMIMHHLMPKESRIDLLGRWSKFAVKTLRYNG